jgi:tetratricopeptide (TPR) repeat protein
MKKIIAFFVFIFSFVSVFCQTAAELHKTAREFMHQGDFGNAVLVLNRAVAMEPKNIEINKDLALNYYFLKDFEKAKNCIKPLLDNDNADDQCYQIAGDIYIALDDIKECEKIYKKGLKKFSLSGTLYNLYGELLWAQKDYSAIKQWEKGIETDPGYSKNYYNACKYYYFSTDKVWSILYGEVFLNIEPLSQQAPEIKNILLEGYKKLFADGDIEKNISGKNDFVQAILKTLNKQASVIAYGINPETLTMLRARFILDWYNNYATKFPFKVFELQRQLLQEGMFDAYNQWIFGTAQNLASYQNWVNTHSTEYGEFSRFQKGRIFKIPSGQYYH